MHIYKIYLLHTYKIYKYIYIYIMFDFCIYVVKHKQVK